MLWVIWHRVTRVLRNTKKILIPCNLNQTLRKHARECKDEHNVGCNRSKVRGYRVITMFKNANLNRFEAVQSKAEGSTKHEHPRMNS